MKSSRKLSLVAAVLLALAAAGASSASASNFYAEEFVAEVKGEATEAHTLGAGELKIQCKKANLTGELLEPSEAQTVAPTYAECTAAGTSATIEANGCTYVLHAGTEETENVVGGTFDIACPKEQSIKVVALGGQCEAKVGAQSGLTSATYQDNPEAEPPTATLKESLTGIHYTITKDGAFCPFPGTGEKTNGTLSGNSTLKAFSEAEQVGMQVKKEGKARLCGATLPEKNGTCPAGNTYKAGTEIQAVANGAGAATISMITKGAVLETVACEQAVVVAENAEEVGNPRLVAQKTSITFGACKDAGGKGNACEVEMTNAPTTASIGAPPAGLWWWPATLYVAMTMSVNCGAKLECKFGTIQENLGITGPNTMATERVRPFSAIEGAACYEQASWFSRLEIIRPEPLWVTI